MIALAAYLALVVTLPALALGHQGEVFPLAEVAAREKQKDRRRERAEIGPPHQLLGEPADETCGRE